MNSFRQTIISLRESPGILGRIIYYLFFSVYFLFKFFLNQRHRSEKISSFLYPNHIHQRSTFTQNNRYPVLFELCKKLIPDYESTSILSFGCSTGEEVNSLRKIFPNPTIYGTDINKFCIRKAKKKFNHPKNIFIHSLSKTFNELTDLDAIFCMAVFQHSANRHDLLIKESKYPFSRYNEEISRLDQKLKKGGLLIIDHTDFDFMESSVSKHYKPLAVDKNFRLRTRPAFDAQNRKVSSQAGFYRIFKKI